MEGDTIVEFDSLNVRAVPHSQLVDMLIDKPIGYRGRLVVKRASPKHRSVEISIFQKEFRFSIATMRPYHQSSINFRTSAVNYIS